MEDLKERLQQGEVVEFINGKMSVNAFKDSLTGQFVVQGVFILCAYNRFEPFKDKLKSIIKKYSLYEL